jgi:hypothetical protein
VPKQRPPPINSPPTKPTLINSGGTFSKQALPESHWDHDSSRNSRKTPPAPPTRPVPKQPEVLSKEDLNETSTKKWETTAPFFTQENPSPEKILIGFEPGTIAPFEMVALYNPPLTGLAEFEIRVESIYRYNQCVLVGVMPRSLARTIRTNGFRSPSLEQVVAFNGITHSPSLKGVFNIKGKADLQGLREGISFRLIVDCYAKTVRIWDKKEYRTVFDLVGSFAFFGEDPVAFVGLNEPSSRIVIDRLR